MAPKDKQVSALTSKSPVGADPSVSSRALISSCTVQRLSQEKHLSSTYQGVRHLIPGNLARLRQLMKRAGGRKQIDSLRVAGRVLGR